MFQFGYYMFDVQGPLTVVGQAITQSNCVLAEGKADTTATPGATSIAVPLVMKGSESLRGCGMTPPVDAGLPPPPDSGPTDLSPPADRDTAPLAPADGAAAEVGCPSVGMVACAGAAGAGRMMCDGRAWVEATSCAPGQSCDRRSGRCQDIAAGCQGQLPGTVVCSQSTRVKCGPDLVDTSVVERCGDPKPVCLDGKCVECHQPGMAQLCAGNTPRTCVGDAWASGAPCTGESPVCVKGACVACTPGEHRCLVNALQRCNEGTWETETTCSGAAPLCRMNSCVPSMPYRLGNDRQLPETYTAPADTLLAFPITIANRTNLTAFGLRARLSGGRVVMALYADANPGGAQPTAPGSKVISSIGTPVDIAGGPEVPVPPAASVDIDPGVYWLGALFDSPVASWIDPNAGMAAVVRYVGSSYPVTPATFPTSTKATGFKYNLYAVFQDY